MTWQHSGQQVTVADLMLELVRLENCLTEQDEHNHQALEAIHTRLDTIETKTLRGILQKLFGWGR